MPTRQRLLEKNRIVSLCTVFDLITGNRRPGLDELQFALPRIESIIRKMSAARDNTPGCTRQACAFAGAYDAFRGQDVVVIGVSKDSVASHVKFAQKYDLPFLLLSDPDLTAIQAYGVWQEKKLYGKPSMGVVRTTYIIDENGLIEKVMPKVKPDTNAAEILEYLASHS